MPSEKEFEQALKEQYSKEFESQRNLDSKATSTISIAGTISSLLFGFGTFLVTRIEPNYPLVQVAITVLVVAVVANVLSVSLAFWASKARKYYFIMTNDIFFQQNDYTEEEIKQAENYNDNEIDEFKRMRPDEFNDILIHDYLRCNKLNHLLNDRKARIVIIAQILFLIGLVMIPVLLFILFHAFQASAIRLT